MANARLLLLRIAAGLTAMLLTIAAAEALSAPPGQPPGESPKPQARAPNTPEAAPVIPVLRADMAPAMNSDARSTASSRSAPSGGSGPGPRASAPVRSGRS